MMKPLDAKAKIQALDRLEVNGWAHLEDRDAIARTYTFPDFVHAMAWMNAAAEVAEEMNHHPEWTNVYNRVTVTLTTHSTKSLTELDIQLADAMDSLCQNPARSPPD